MSLRTVSLRRRVTLSAIGVLGVVLIGVVLLVDALFAAQSKRDVDTALLEKARVAQQLVKQRVRGAELVDRLEGRGVELRLVMPDGTVVGNTPDEEVAKEVSLQLLDGSKITVYAESSVITAAQTRLRRLLLLAGIGALAVTAGAMVLVVRRALAPLDAMTTLARSIARGNRGYRLNPSRADNELGRTAAAFDDMLDSLEGSEERTKRFVADAAHELRTPIAGVQAVAEALMQTASAEERERLNLLLVRESRRAGRLVDDLLALARIEAGLELHRERVDLLALAEAEVGRTQLLAPDFDIAAEGESAFVSGDPQRLAQVLANLADNARQATGPSGRVRLRVSRVGGTARLVVSDNGPGVPPEERERIFDRLVRLDEARDQRSGGSGLGLPIARGVVRAHGGELSCITLGSDGNDANDSREAEVHSPHSPHNPPPSTDRPVLSRSRPPAANVRDAGVARPAPVAAVAGAARPTTDPQDRGLPDAVAHPQNTAPPSPTTDRKGSPPPSPTADRNGSAQPSPTAHPQNTAPSPTAQPQGSTRSDLIADPQDVPGRGAVTDAQGHVARGAVVTDRQGCTPDNPIADPPDLPRRGADADAQGVMARGAVADPAGHVPFGGVAEVGGAVGRRGEGIGSVGAAFEVRIPLDE